MTDTFNLTQSTRLIREKLVSDLPLKTESIPTSGVAIVLATSLYCLACVTQNGFAAGVTVITHGYDSDVNGWITGMADRIPEYDSFPGTNFTTYKITLTTDGSSYFYQWQRTNGSAPSITDSGEIIVKLDWSNMAGGGSAPYDLSTYVVARIAGFVLLQTNAIADLEGHALAEFPLHLIGHSRGGSLVSEMSRLLGTNGVWIDHVTTLDPHPFNNDGNFEPFFPTDAPASNTWINVLFQDNYWQNLEFFTDGEPVFGAYNRQFNDLSGGYSSSHSDVHLWYHGTLDWLTPTTDSEATITGAERTNWWVTYENFGVVAGFHYSLISQGNRLSTDQPLGLDAIRDGYNQWWDLGAGTSSNRMLLSTNFGNWPNLIRFNRTTTNQVVFGQSTPLRFYYQWARPPTTNAVIRIYLDDDFNPLNTNQTLLKEIMVPATGAASVNIMTTNITLTAANAAPGHHLFFASISGGGRTRYLYCPEAVDVVPTLEPPRLDITKLSGLQFQIGVHGSAGQTIVLQNSDDLVAWFPLATNTLVTNLWLYTNAPPADSNRNFYRAVVEP